MVQERRRRRRRRRAAAGSSAVAGAFFKLSARAGAAAAAVCLRAGVWGARHTKHMRFWGPSRRHGGEKGRNVLRRRHCSSASTIVRWRERARCCAAAGEGGVREEGDAVFQERVREKRKAAAFCKGCAVGWVESVDETLAAALPWWKGRDRGGRKREGGVFSALFCEVQCKGSNGETKEKKRGMVVSLSDARARTNAARLLTRPARQQRPLLPQAPPLRRRRPHAAPRPRPRPRPRPPQGSRAAAARPPPRRAAARAGGR